MTFDNLIENVSQWADDKNILKKENAPKQLLKVMEEVGETAGALLKNKEAELKDGIGDSFVTLIILAKQLGLEPADCLEAAWNEIKDRTGKTENGVFIKN
jgi:NTP pyrophosphatase (non-canonical NTP hydrolase)